MSTQTGLLTLLDHNGFGLHPGLKLGLRNLLEASAMMQLGPEASWDDI